MSTDELGSGTSVSTSGEPLDQFVETVGEIPERKLEIAVTITDVGPCKKHLKITIPRDEIDRQYEKSLESLRKEAVVPGFRLGRAPRQLVVKRFKKEVSGQVKSTLLMSSLEQIEEDYKLQPITQPRLDVDAIEIPDKGPLNFEMDVEVRPEFDVPSYAGQKITRPVAELTDALVEEQLTRFLEGHAHVVPKLEGAAEFGDYLTADLAFFGPSGEPLNEFNEVQFRLQPEIRFQDGVIADASVLEGAKPGETREVEAKLGTAVADPALRETTIKMQCRVNDLKRLKLPDLNQAFLDSINVENEESLREAVRGILARRIRTEQRQAMSRQLLDQLLSKTPFALPADLVSREERSTIKRLVTQLKREGMSDDDIKAHEAQIRANAHETTLRSLKELLLLSKIAEAENITVDDNDLEIEIEAMADRTGESARRIRSRVEKEGGTESLGTQLLERKVIDRILESCEIEDVAVAIQPERRVETLDISATAPAAEADEETQSEDVEKES